MEYSKESSPTPDPLFQNMHLTDAINAKRRQAEMALRKQNSKRNMILQQDQTTADMQMTHSGASFAQDKYYTGPDYKSFFKEVLIKIGHSPTGKSGMGTSYSGASGDFIDQTMNHLQKTDPEMFVLEVILSALQHSSEANVVKVSHPLMQKRHSVPPPKLQQEMQHLYGSPWPYRKKRKPKESEIFNISNCI